MQPFHVWKAAAAPRAQQGKSHTAMKGGAAPCGCAGSPHRPTRAAAAGSGHVRFCPCGQCGRRGAQRHLGPVAGRIAQSRPHLGCPSPLQPRPCTAIRLHAEPDLTSCFEHQHPSLVQACRRKDCADGCTTGAWTWTHSQSFSTAIGPAWGLHAFDTQRICTSRLCSEGCQGCLALRLLHLAVQR